MSLSAEQKVKIVSSYKQSDKDTGSTEVQVALITTRIKRLTEHFKVNHKDNHSRRGLQHLVNNRRSLLKYLKRTQPTRYESLIKRLALRDSY